MDQDGNLTGRRDRSLGEQELELLRWIVEHGPSAVAEVAEGFGAPLKLSRSTVNTMMERLRLKGYLTRSRCDGVYRYSSPVAPEALLGGLVQRFVEKTLAGSLSPLIAYFAKSHELSPEERAQLESLLSRLQAQEAAQSEREADQ